MIEEGFDRKSSADIPTSGHAKLIQSIMNNMDEIKQLARSDWHIIPVSVYVNHSDGERETFAMAEW